MELEENRIRLLSFSYHDLQCLCKKYNLPANKSHSQLAASLALLLEKGNLNSAHARKTSFGSTQASLATSSALLSNIKVASRCFPGTGILEDNHKRGPYSDRDDEDRPFSHVKHQKGSQIPMNEALINDSGTRMSFPPVCINNEKADCFTHSPSGQGIFQDVQSPNNNGIAKKSVTPELANMNGGISLVASYPAPNARLGDNAVDKGSGSSDKTSANATSSFQFFVMSDEGLDLFVDLNSTPSDQIDSFKSQLHIPPIAHHSESGIFSNFISNLVSQDDHSTVSPSGDIFVDKQNGGAEDIAACTNSSLGSSGENSHSEPYPPDTTAVHSMSSAFMLPGTLVGISGSQQGVPVLSSSSLTSDVHNIMSSGMTDGALNNKVPLEKSVDISVWSERNHAMLADGATQPVGTNDIMSPGKMEVPIKIGCTQNVMVADTEKATTFSSGDVAKSDSDENSCPISLREQEMLSVPAGSQLTHNANTNEALTQNQPVETVPVEEDRCCGDMLSISLGDVQPVKDARSDPSSAGHCVPGYFDLTDPTPSSAASDNAITPLTSKHCAESAESDDSANKKGLCDPEEYETQQASGVPTRNILLSLRSASARQATLPRRSARLVPKKPQ